MLSSVLYRSLRNVSTARGDRRLKEIGGLQTPCATHMKDAKPDQCFDLFSQQAHPHSRLRAEVCGLARSMQHAAAARNLRRRPC